MPQHINLPSNPVEWFISFDDYVRERPQFFPNPSSARYFMRWQRRILREAGALIYTPADDLVLAAVIDAYILRINKAGKNFQTQDLKDELSDLMRSRAIRTSDPFSTGDDDEMPF